MLRLEPYLPQNARWPTAGRHILAQFDADSVVVYQAFRPAIAEEAVTLQRFGPSFSLSRMSWIKPNFLWMMFRCGWATKEDQERVLALRLRRAFFERLLRAAVPSTYSEDAWPSEKAWQDAVRRSDVRLQWDPDHGPTGNPVTRRAIQLGLRGPTLAEFAGPALLQVLDVTDLVARERPPATPPFESLHTPSESVFRPEDPATVAALGLDSWEERPSTLEQP
jgi:hypothetical protein